METPEPRSHPAEPLDAHRIPSGDSIIALRDEVIKVVNEELEEWRILANMCGGGRRLLGRREGVGCT